MSAFVSKAIKASFMSIKPLIKSCIRAPLELCAASFGQHRAKCAYPRLWILMYHRILPQTDSRYTEEEPGMIVTPDTLEMHIRELKSLFEIMALQDWVQRIKTGKPLPANACAITFDDGWLDNYQYAYPILLKHQIPASIFVVSHMLGTNQQFWPNRVAALLQQSPHTAAKLPWLNDLLTHNTENPRELQAQAIYQLKTYSDADILSRLSEAEALADVTLPDSPCLINWEQAREMANSGLIDFGSHTCHHVRLRPDTPQEVLFKEITDSKKTIENQLNRPVNLFCYPNGDFCPAAESLVTEHYDAAVTTKKGINTAQSNPSLLHRFGVHEDSTHSPTKLFARLSGWPKT